MAAIDFKAAAEKKEVKETVLKTVQLDSQVALKIMQHCNDSLPNLVTGQLLGLDVGQTLEVTDCFPFPSSAGEDGDDDVSGASYQLDMMRCLREVNVDNNTVGWYQSTVLGSFQTVEFIETFVNYYESIKKCVCIVYDPQRSTRGSVSMTAIRLKDSFIEAYKEHKMSAEKMREANISWKDIFQEVPIKVHNSSLITALVSEFESDRLSGQSDFDRLSLSLAPFLEKNMESLIGCVNDLVAEQQNVSQYHKSVARQQQQMANWLQKRRQENLARKAAGEEPLPEEDPVLFKPVPEPSQLDAYLIANQIGTYCDQINGATTQSLQKVFLMEAFQRALL